MYIGRVPDRKESSSEKVARLGAGQCPSLAACSSPYALEAPPQQPSATIGWLPEAPPKREAVAGTGRGPLSAPANREPILRSAWAGDSGTSGCWVRWWNTSALNCAENNSSRGCAASSDEIGF